MMAEANFGDVHEGNFRKATDWWREGKAEKVKVYCQQDVKLTMHLFSDGVRNGELKFFRYNKKNDPDVIDTKYWREKFLSICAGEESPTAELIEDMELSLLLDLKLIMKNYSKDGNMNHEQERSVISLVSSMRATVKALEALDGPVKVGGVESYLKRKLGD